MEPPANYSPDAALVFRHIASSARTTFCAPAGVLGFPYICPGGYYSQLWDWDAVFAGLGALSFGSAPYLCGSMKNFFAATTPEGRVPGCLTPKGPSATLAHAKPVLIWGALLGARAAGDLEQFRDYLPAMEALLGFWDRERRDAETGLYVWHVRVLFRFFFRCCCRPSQHTANANTNCQRRGAGPNGVRR